MTTEKQFTKAVCSTKITSKRVNILSSFKTPSMQVALVFTGKEGLSLVSRDDKVGSCVLQIAKGDIEESSEVHVVAVEDIKKLINSCKDGTVTFEVNDTDDDDVRIHVQSGNVKGDMSTLLEKEILIDTTEIVKDVSQTPSKDAKCFSVPKDAFHKMTNCVVARDAYKEYTEGTSLRYMNSFFNVNANRIKFCRYAMKNAVHLSWICDQEDVKDNIGFCIKNDTLDTLVNQLCSIEVQLAAKDDKVTTETMLSITVDVSDNVMYISLLDADKIKIPINTRIGVNSDDVDEFDKIRQNVEGKQRDEVYDTKGEVKVNAKKLIEALRTCSSVSEEGKVNIDVAVEDKCITINSTGASIDLSTTIDILPQDKAEDIYFEGQYAAFLLAGVESINNLYADSEIYLEGLSKKAGDAKGFNLITFKDPSYNFYGVAVWSKT